MVIPFMFQWILIKITGFHLWTGFGKYFLQKKTNWIRKRFEWEVLFQVSLHFHWIAFIDFAYTYKPYLLHIFGHLFLLSPLNCILLRVCFILSSLLVAFYAGYCMYVYTVQRFTNSKRYLFIKLSYIYAQRIVKHKVNGL